MLSHLPSMGFRQHPELLKDLIPWSDYLKLAKLATLVLGFFHCFQMYIRNLRRSHSFALLRDFR